MTAKLSTRLGDIEDILATVRYLNEAVFMAGHGIGDMEKCNAIQAVCDEMNNKLLIARDRLDEIRDELVSATGPASSGIVEMYAEWLTIRHRPIKGQADDDLAEDSSRYQELQKAIISAEPLTPRDVAIMFLVDTDDDESVHSDIFVSRIRKLAGPSPSSNVIREEME